MRRIAVAAALLGALPLPASAAPPSQAPLRAYVLTRVSADATAPAVTGGAGADDHQYAYAAVAAVDLRPDGRLGDAHGALFFGVNVESDPHGSGAASPVRCSQVPAAGQACATYAGGGIAFGVWWEDTSVDQVVVVMRGNRQRVEPAEGVRGWKVVPWRGAVREVAGDLAGVTAQPYGLGSFVDAQSFGGPGGSVAIGHPPCKQVAYVGAGAGAVQLFGGTREPMAACPATFDPPAAAAPGGTEWTFTGSTTGVSDIPVRMVVLEAPARR